MIFLDYLCDMILKRTITYLLVAGMALMFSFSSCSTSKKVVTGEKGQVVSPKSSHSKRNVKKSKRLKLADDVSYDDDFVPSKRNPVMWVDESTIDPVIINRVLAEAKTWLGTRYVYGGNTRYGIDCSGFVKNVYQNALGVNISRTATLQQRECTLLNRDELEPGDLIFFATVKGPGVIAHVGMYVGDGMMIHASSRRGVIYSPVDGGYYLEKWHSAGRLNKVIDQNDSLAKQFKKEAKTGKRQVVRQSESTPIVSKPPTKPETGSAAPPPAKTTETQPISITVKSSPSPKLSATHATVAASASSNDAKMEKTSMKPSEKKPTPAETKPADVEKKESAKPSALDLIISEKTDSIYNKSANPIK